VKDIGTLRQSTLVSSKVILELQALYILNGTTSFPDNMCQGLGVPSMVDYLINALTNEIFTSYAPFLDRLSQGKMNP